MIPILQDATGYFGVALPQQRFWQCFFLPSIDDEFAESLLLQMRTLCRPGSVSAQTVMNRPTPGVADADQLVFGTILATMCDLAVRGDGRRLGAVAPLAARLANSNYFWIRGITDANGITTEFNPLDVTTVDQAREVLPSVIEKVVADKFRP